jgi:hypothetical protein
MSNDTDMNAKDLIRGRLHEAEGEELFGGTPPGSTGGPSRPMPNRPLRRPGGPMGGPPSLRRMMGGPGEEGAPGFFNPRETNQLKDILIFTLASMLHSENDLRIAQALMAGQELDPGQLQHVLDEASRLKLPESHKPVLQKIYQKLSA